VRLPKHCLQQRFQPPAALFAALFGCWGFADAREEAAAKLPEAGRRPVELPEFLRVYDLDGDGVLSEEERQVARDIRDERLDNPSNPWDFDGDGTLSSEELRAARSELEERIEEKRRERFDEADRDGDGYISEEEFRSLPAISGLAPEKISVALEKLDGNGDGLIGKDEFLAALRKVRPAPVGKTDTARPRPVPVKKPR